MTAGLASALVASLVLLSQALLDQRVYPQWDYILHLRWTGEFAALLRAGTIFPRWISAAHGGLGDPTFLFYQPLLYYLASVFTAVGVSTASALLWAAWIPFLLLGLITARSLPDHATPRATLFAVAFVVTSPAPFLLYSQTAAFPWVFGLPFGLLLVLEAIRPTPDLGRASAWFALLCLSHILSGLMVLMVTSIGRLLLFPVSRETFAGHIRFGASLAMGMALAGFYLFPALTLQGLISPSGWQSDPYLDWHRGFTFPTWTYTRFGWNWFSLQIPVPLLALAMSSAVLISGRRTNQTIALHETGQHVARRLASISIVGLVLSSELAYPLYDLSGTMQMLQHPYRFAVLSEVLASIALAVHVTSTRRTSLRNRRFVDAGIAAAMCGFLMTLYLESSIYRSGSTSPSYEAVASGDFGQPEYLPATVGPDWKAYDKVGGLLADCRALEVVCNPTEPDGSSFRMHIDSRDPVRMRLPLFAFPAWQTRVDGMVRETTIDPRTGLLAVELPAGAHEVSVRWNTLPEEWIGRAFSIAGLIFFASRIVLPRVRARGQPMEPG